VAAPYADGPGEARLSCGEAYVISLPDTDGDGLLDIADPCPNDIDCDDDQYSDRVEMYIGTDPLDACPDDSDDDAWPPDTQGGLGCGLHNGRIDILDIICYGPKVSGPYDPRYDLSANGVVNILDVLLYWPVIGTQCTKP